MNKTCLEATVVGCMLTILYKQLPQGTPFRVFFTGFFAHLARELLGINRWYCQNGNACMKKTPIEV